MLMLFVTKCYCTAVGIIFSISGSGLIGYSSEKQMPLLHSIEKENSKKYILEFNVKCKII